MGMLLKDVMRAFQTYNSENDTRLTTNFLGWVAGDILYSNKNGDINLSNRDKLFLSEVVYECSYPGFIYGRVRRNIVSKELSRILGSFFVKDENAQQR